MNNILTIGGLQVDELIDTYGSPLYAYDAETIRQRFQELRTAITYPKIDLHYACKANTNVSILKLLKEEGACIDTVSPGEVFLAMHAGYTPEQILFTGNNVTDEEMRFLVDRRILINVDALSQIDRYGRIAPDTRISLRINPDVGSGHHDHCITGGPKSKFGLPLEHLDEANKRIDQYGLTVIGLHMHVGSGILDPSPFLQASEALLSIVSRFTDLDFIDFGGGFGIPYEPDERPLDIAALGARLSDRFQSVCDEYGKPLTLKLEPGRYIIGEAGTLLTRCNTVKATNGRTFAGTDSGFHQLMRHSLYGSYHEIVNASNPDDATERYDICGNICESTDFFARERPVARIREGDILAILDAGAYGFSMSSNYNTRPRPAEVLIDHGKARIIRQRETFEDLLRGQA